MSLRYAAVVTVGVALGSVGGWAVGSTRADCEYTCPAHGAPCPLPPDCLRHSFNWAGAIVVGLLITAVLIGIAGLAFRNAAND